MSNDSKQENKVWYNGSGHEVIVCGYYYYLFLKIEFDY